MVTHYGFYGTPLAFIPKDQIITATMAAFNCCQTAHSILILCEYYTLQYTLLTYFDSGIKLMTSHPRI